MEIFSVQPLASKYKVLLDADLFCEYLSTLTEFNDWACLNKDLYIRKLADQTGNSIMRLLHTRNSLCCEQEPAFLVTRCSVYHSIRGELVAFFYLYLKKLLSVVFLNKMSGTVASVSSEIFLLRLVLRATYPTNEANVHLWGHQSASFLIF